ncbi:peptidyl-prolyl cis-trans isomerase [Sulfurimonas sp. C5]|uniref:peptidylprolyl isomerase n=1 Tax=Sulfurimonas sp. C5 TaxID=3036947 RepID=UPI002457F331|nr:peptidyl-prolyl cis-trans isomerase [Sulfurimonas sp. C5]MDH4945168.1 peptidyl-prolyl cis-trans isomerase [Sulfurimonas sp. C5]
MIKAKKLLSVVLLAGTIASAQTLVTVNGKSITQEDVDSELMRATQGRFNQVPPEKQAAFRQQVLQQLIGKELIFEDAKKNGVLKTKEYKEEYKKLEERMKQELAIQVWQKQLLDGIKISEKELKDYYKQNKEEFNEPESVHARHILVATEDEAKSIIAGLKPLSGDKLKNKFIEEAKAKSTGPSGPKGGDLGYFTQGQMVPEFNDKAFSMKKGTVTLEPVKTQFGYHVIYVEDKKPAMIRKYDEVKAFIEQRLKMEKFKDAMKKKMDALQKKAVIK